VKQFKLAPDPAKITDPRAGAYIKLHGKRSWEVDAFKPNQLEAIIETAMQQHIDVPKYNAWIKVEETDKAYLEKALHEYRNPPAAKKTKRRKKS